MSSPEAYLHQNVRFLCKAVEPDYLNPHLTKEGQPHPINLSSQAIEVINAYAPIHQRGEFIRHPLAALSALAIYDLKETLDAKAKHPLTHAQITEIKQASLLFSHPENQQAQLILIGLAVGDLLHAHTNFFRSFNCSPEQQLRLSRYTVYGSNPDKLEGFQRDTIYSTLGIAGFLARSLTHTAASQGFMNHEETNLELYHTIMQQRWFTHLLQIAQYTANGVWGPYSPHSETNENDLLDDIKDAKQTAHMWHFNGHPLRDSNAVTFSPDFTSLLREARAGNVPTSNDYLTNRMPSVGCPVLYQHPEFSDNPTDINYLTPEQIKRFENSPIATVSDHTITLHTSAEDFILETYQTAIRQYIAE